MNLKLIQNQSTGIIHKHYVYVGILHKSIVTRVLQTFNFDEAAFVSKFKLQRLLKPTMYDNNYIVIERTLINDIAFSIKQHFVYNTRCLSFRKMYFKTLDEIKL